MELFKNTNYDFLGKKWPFIIASLVLTGIGFASLIARGGPRYGIDFRGGTKMYVKFQDKPQVEKIRAALRAKIGGEISVVEIADSLSSKNEVMIDTELREERELDAARRGMVESLNATFGQSSGKLDINNSGQQALAERMRDPLARAGASLSDRQLQDLCKAILIYRDTPPRSGLIKSFDELSQVAGVTPQVIAAMNQELYAAPFSIRTVEIVGPKVGGELRQQAILATLYALGGMLVYIAFRFEWIYGVAAVVAVFHDTLITIGLFSVFDKEISLTAVAALLTLVGYSMNDTIVVFDRIRENLKLLRREKLEALINISVNQTLSRTILTSGLTLLTALSLWIFGGQVLNGFSFALVVGIIVGTYSSVFIASPILVFWQNYTDRNKPPAVAVGPSPKVKAAK
jgi:preprotein translocase subunit SecF